MAPVTNGSTSDNIRNFALPLKTVHVFRIKEKPVRETTVNTTFSLLVTATISKEIYTNVDERRQFCNAMEIVCNFIINNKFLESLANKLL